MPDRNGASTPSNSASYLFTGRHVSRPAINLGGSQGVAPKLDLVERARQERISRELTRKQEMAAIKIQAIYRSRTQARQTRQQLRSRFDSLAASSKSLAPNEIVELTRLIVLSSVTDDRGDIQRLAQWCRVVLVPCSSSGKTPALFALHQIDPPRWLILLRQVALRLLQQAVEQPDLSQTPLFLELIKIIADPTSAADQRFVGDSVSPLTYLVERDLFFQIRKLIAAIPMDHREHRAIQTAIALSLLPFKPFLAQPQSAPWIDSFFINLFSVPLLARRLPLASLKALNSSPAISQILVKASQRQLDTVIVSLTAADAIHVLANTVAFLRLRVATFETSQMVNGYLHVVRLLLDRIPSRMIGVDSQDSDVPALAQLADVDADDLHDEMATSGAEEWSLQSQETLPRLKGTSSAHVHVDLPRDDSEQTSLRLSIKHLTDRGHLHALLTASTKFSASSRPFLASFLVSLLSVCPTKRAAVTNDILFGVAHASDRNAGRAGGLLREIYRGYIRSGRLGKLIGTGSSKASDRASLVAALVDTSLAYDWPFIILLAELYGRCLLTMGDDEFFSAGNPLSLDEVVEFSGLLRNLAFALYWQEEAWRAEETTLIAGTRTSIKQLKTTVTNVLKQLHSRDSRRSFASSDHWSMTSQFDLSSFIQSVIYDDNKTEEGDLPEAVNENTIMPAPRERAHISKRHAAFFNPRLGVLNNVPFVIPFEERVIIFRQLVDNDRKRLGLDRDRYTRGMRHRATIRRTNLAEDAYKQLNGLGMALKRSIEITFVNEFGEEEIGIDGGGLFKELLTSLSKEVFDTDRGLWMQNVERELYPSPHSYARESAQLEWYRFIGRVLGKALYEGILLDVQFADFFLSKWLGRTSFLDDLASLDPELYNGLLFLKKHAGDVETDLSLNFTVSDEEFGVSRTIELVPGGKDIAVTNENRMHYIILVANYRLNVQLEKQYAAFFAGLAEIVPSRWLRLFSQRELKVLVGGAHHEIDVNDLRANTVYGGWDGEEANETIRLFWQVVQKFDNKQRADLVKFVTSCGRPPLLGFQELNPRFAIRHAGDDQTRLPSASTCVNLLKLPAFTDEAQLRTKLLYAIESGAGFDLS
ncbi:hypothetical protein ACM66B_006527 [Microbotryomycetes sp. NB124-2]